MRLGYPTVNTELELKPSNPLRLKSYSPEQFRQTVEANLAGLLKILEWNMAHDLLLFRISSEIIPFAADPVCKIDWANENAAQLKLIGQYIQKHDMRISMHPDQFVLINSLDLGTFQASLAELNYHARFLEALGLDASHKIQIHVGGIYGHKSQSMDRFIQRHGLLPQAVKDRLVIENDDRLFSLQDCLYLSQQTATPVLFNNLHHQLLNASETITQAFDLSRQTWQVVDGVPMTDYSSPKPTVSRQGSHSNSIDLTDFKQYLQQIQKYDFDIMLDFKDKQVSALQAIELVKSVRK